MSILSLDIESLKELEANAPEQVPVDLEYEKEQRLKLIEKINDNLGVPYHNTFDEWDQSCWIDGYNAAVSAVSLLKAPVRQHHNVFLCGSTGSGKSWLGRSIAYQYCIENNTHSCFMIDELQLFNSWKASFGYNKSATHDFNKTIKRMKNSKILVYDELGKQQLAADIEGETVTPYGAIVYDVLNDRYKNNRGTILCTQIVNETKRNKIIGKAFYRRVLNWQNGIKNCTEIIKK